MAVRALVFDVFGTLVDWRSGIARAFLASKVSGDPEELADAWRARFWPMLAAVNGGERPWANFDELHAVFIVAPRAVLRRTAPRKLKNSQGEQSKACLGGRPFERHDYRYD